MSPTPDFTIGIEEEYLLVSRDTGALTEVPSQLMRACEGMLGDQVSPEYLQCQMEVGTEVCATVAEARDELRRLRGAIAKEAAKHGLAPIAASCHPSADWKDQHHTHKERYDQLREDLAGVVRRLLICGMHVHVGLRSDALRADLMGQLKAMA